MLPIVLGLIPTLVGAGLFVGLKSIPQNKGPLLFGEQTKHFVHGLRNSTQSAYRN